MFTKGEIIINGRRLNKIQEWFFEKSNNYIQKLFIRVQLVLILSLVSTMLFFLMTQQEIYLLINIFLIVLIVAFYEKLIIKVVHINAGVFYNLSEKNILKIFKKSWIINVDMLNEMLNKTLYEKEAVSMEIMKKSSGHKIIDEIKNIIAQYNPYMINYATEISFEAIRNLMDYYNKKSIAVKVSQEKINFRKKKVRALRKLYSVAMGIDPMNNFQQRVINSKTKETLLIFFENNFHQSEKNDK